MGNFHSAFDFNAKAALVRLPWERVQKLWQRAEDVLGDKHSASTCIDRNQFMDIFTDTSSLEDGRYTDAPLSLFRSFDYGYRNKAVLYHLFAIIALFCESRSSSAEARWQFVLRTLFAKGAASDPEDAATAAEIATAITSMNAALVTVGIVSRVAEGGEVADIVNALLLEVMGPTNSGKVPLTKLIKWLTTTKAMATLVQRFQMMLEQYERLADSGGLPPLMSVPDAPARRNGATGGQRHHKPTVQEEEAVRLKALKSVASRSVLAELGFKTGLTLGELLQLRREFGSVSTGHGVVDLSGFKTIMARCFPALAEDHETEMYLGNRGRRNSVDIHGRKSSIAEQAARRGSVAGFGGASGMPHSARRSSQTQGLPQLQRGHRSTLDRLFDAFDADASDTIEFKEFALGCAKMAKGSVRDKTDLLFGLLDGESKGTVSLHELTRFVQGGASELQAIHDSAIASVHNIAVKTAGIITEQEFASYMLSDPALPGWFSSVTHSAPLALVNKALEEITELLGLGQQMLSSTPATAAAMPGSMRLSVAGSGGAGSPSRHNEDEGHASRHGGVNTASMTLFTFDRLLMWWSERLMAMGRESKRTAANFGRDAGGRIPVRAGLPGIGVGARPESQLMLKSQCDCNDVMVLLEYVFELEDLNPRARNGYKGAVRFFYETLVAASVSDDSTDVSSDGARATRQAALERQHALRKGEKVARSPEEAAYMESLASHLMPTKLVLHVLGLCLCRTPEELALVLYRQADANDKGNITTADLQRFITIQQDSSSHALKAAQAILGQLDLDGDGVINEVEFRAGLSKFPGLFDAFGVLMGGQGHVNPMQTELQYKLPTNKRPTAGEDAGGVSSVAGVGGRASPGGAQGGFGVTLDTTGPKLPSWAVDPHATSRSFAGINVVGLGAELAPEDVVGGSMGEYKNMSVEEQIRWRQRQYTKRGQRIEKHLGALVTDAMSLTRKVVPVMDEKLAEMRKQVQQDKAGVHQARQMLKVIHDAKQSTRPRPATARPSTARPGTAAAVRPGTATVRPLPGVYGRLSPVRPPSAVATRTLAATHKDKNGAPLPAGQKDWLQTGLPKFVQFPFKDLVVQNKGADRMFDG